MRRKKRERRVAPWRTRGQRVGSDSLTVAPESYPTHHLFRNRKKHVVSTPPRSYGPHGGEERGSWALTMASLLAFLYLYQATVVLWENVIFSRRHLTATAPAGHALHRHKSRVSNQNSGFISITEDMIALSIGTLALWYTPPLCNWEGARRIRCSSRLAFDGACTVYRGLAIALLALVRVLSTHSAWRRR